MASDRVVLFENVAGLGKGYLQGIAGDDILLAGGLKRGTSSISIDGSGNVTAAGANVTVSAAADLALSAADDLTLVSVDLISTSTTAALSATTTVILSSGTDMTLLAGDDLILTATDSILLTGSPITALSYFETTATATKAAIHIGMVVGDPSTLNDGDIWYNTTTAKFRKRENGISSNFVASEAATFVVHPTAGVGDYTTIQDAINNLPAEGGLIFVREGTYNITTTITMPNKPVAIVGCGEECTIIDLGSNAIYAFTSSFTGTQFQFHTFRDIAIHGNGTLNQKGFFIDDPSFFTQLSLQNVFINNVDIMVHDENSSGIDFDFVACVLADRAGVLHYECPTPGNGTLWIANCTWENVNGAFKRGGMSGAPFVNITNSRLDSGTTMDLGRAQITGSRFASDGATNKKISMGDTRGAEMSSCEFRGGAYLEFTTGPCTAVGNIFRDSPTRAIDVLAAITSGTISGNAFTWTTEAIRIAGSGIVVSGNNNCKVTETGAADSNHYLNILSTSTVLGASSTVEGARRFDITGVTTSSFVTLFTHVNPKGLVGIGTIKNTDGVDSLDIRETVIDAFGNTVSTVTTVAAGDTYMLDPQTDFSTTCFPPYVSYMVEVTDTSAGNHATFELHQVSQGAL